MSAGTQAAASGAKVVVAVDPDRAFRSVTAESTVVEEGQPVLEDGPQLGLVRARVAALHRGVRRGRRGLRDRPDHGVDPQAPGYTWRQSDWPDDAITDVELTFEPDRRRARVSHASDRWERVARRLEIAKGSAWGARCSMVASAWPMLYGGDRVLTSRCHAASSSARPGSFARTCVNRGRERSDRRGASRFRPRRPSLTSKATSRGTDLFAGSIRPGPSRPRHDAVRQSVSMLAGMIKPRSSRTPRPRRMTSIVEGRA